MRSLACFPLALPLSVVLYLTPAAATLARAGVVVPACGHSDVDALVGFLVEAMGGRAARGPVGSATSHAVVLPGQPLQPDARCAWSQGQRALPGAMNSGAAGGRGGLVRARVAGAVARVPLAHTRTSHRHRLRAATRLP